MEWLLPILVVIRNFANFTNAPDFQQAISSGSAVFAAEIIRHLLVDF